jgi:D-3-phosphoglycerate dehydrogenase
MSCLLDLAQVDTVVPDGRVISRILPQHEAYFATLKVKLSKKLLERCPDLKVIATPSTGTDHLPMAYLNKRGVKVISLRQHPELIKKISSTAELTWGLLLSLIRRIPAGFASVRAGEWRRDDFIGHQLSGKTLGIIGYGRLGKIVTKYGLAFGMRVMVYDSIPPVRVPRGISAVSLDELLKKSDVISLHIHLDRQNIGFLDAAKMDKMKNDAIIINTSRGAIIDEAALLERLAAGRLGGAGVDVIDGEWEVSDTNPMVEYAREHDNLLITPHIGGVSYEAQQLAVGYTAMQLKKFIKESALEYAY